MTKPLRVSWSGLRVFEECHQKSALIREGKRSKVSNIRNFFAGMVVDNIMRDWLDQPDLRHGDTQALVSAAMDSMEDTERGKGNMVKWRDAADRDQIRQFCVNLVDRLEPLLEEHVLPHSYEHGKWFKVPLSITDRNGQPRDILLTGEMDLLVDNDGPVVWDLKGTADDEYYRKVVAQLTFYDVAVWASSGVKTRFVGLIQPMCTQQIRAWEVTDDARAQLLSRIERYANGVWADERACTDKTAVCHWCDVRHACPRYSQPGIDVFGDLAGGLRAAAGEPT
jgi:hypothetical protein